VTLQPVVAKIRAADASKAGRGQLRPARVSQEAARAAWTQSKIPVRLETLLGSTGQPQLAADADPPARSPARADSPVRTHCTSHVFRQTAAPCRPSYSVASDAASSVHDAPSGPFRKLVASDGRVVYEHLDPAAPAISPLLQFIDEDGRSVWKLVEDHRDDDGHGDDERFNNEDSHLEGHICRWNDCGVALPDDVGQRLKHIRVTHRPTASEALLGGRAQCKWADCVSLIRPGSLRYHLRAHLGDSVACPTCGDVYGRPEDLARHRSKPGSCTRCPACGISFADVGERRRHIESTPCGTKRTRGRAVVVRRAEHRLATTSGPARVVASLPSPIVAATPAIDAPVPEAPADAAIIAARRSKHWNICLGRDYASVEFDEEV
jgi:uncharacterized C2H2 Zn-finger protein